MVQRSHIVVVDIEATCWRDKYDRPEGSQREIIEIGICLYNVKTGDITHPQGILVKPTRSTVSDFCTELTTLTQQQVDTGGTFEAACQQLQDDYHSKSYLWASWGDFDRQMFETQCASFSVEYPFSTHHVNLKKLMAQIEDKRPMGMKRALNALGLDLIGTHHRGVDDSVNIARILHHLLEKHGRDMLLPYWMS
ncbi:MAG: exonuclease domain-containing protein [Aggregatilineales bacterium]